MQRYAMAAHLKIMAVQVQTPSSNRFISIPKTAPWAVLGLADFCLGIAKALL